MRRRLTALLLTVLLASAACSAFGRVAVRWRDARRDSSGQAPDPATTRDAIVQVYAARAVGWRGVFALHTWIAVKHADAATWRRYEVMGWGVDHGAPALRVDRGGPDDYWFGARPELLVDRRGKDVEALIDRVEAAVRGYPYRRAYRTWPGPNSNTFTAYVGRAVPELHLRMPPNAVGKDYLPHGGAFATTPAGRGVQVSLLGVAGVLAGWDEGVEINVLGLTFGVDPLGPAVSLPVAGRLGR